ncbi:MAG: hypothetical protein HYW15_01005 [Candidatus Giovannonibacteria bacterium]|nr:MAG: hypothetical protein HYW15_01005 [Candidatus Giovannonibacteria bacterium]
MKGATLLELLLSIFVVAVIAGILVSAFGVFRESNDLRVAQNTIVGMLKDARSRAIASESNSVYGVHFETAKSVLFKGAAYNVSDPANETYTLSPSLQISNINLAGGTSDAVFSRLQGTTTSFGTITLSSKNAPSKTRVIIIYQTGLAQ